jgi:hypothetical protein
MNVAVMKYIWRSGRENEPNFEEFDGFRDNDCSGDEEKNFRIVRGFCTDYATNQFGGTPNGTGRRPVLQQLFRTLGNNRSGANKGQSRRVRAKISFWEHSIETWRQSAELPLRCVIESGWDSRKSPDGQNVARCCGQECPRSADACADMNSELILTP